MEEEQFSKQNSKAAKRGFTLIELLVVVLIIGILAAISLPMYRKTVEKSKVADALTTMSAVSESEHSWYLAKNNYTQNFSDLDIDLNDGAGNPATNQTFTSRNYTFTLQNNHITAERNNGEYMLYKLYEHQDMYCLPEDHVICQEFLPINRNFCENTMNRLWHNSTSACYSSEEERCVSEYGESLWHSSYCGYLNNKSKEIKEGMACYGNLTGTSSDSGCRNSTVEKGATCYGNGKWGCAYSTINGGKCDSIQGSGCNYVTLNDGGICQGTGGCQISTVNSGSVCKADGYMACYKSIINDGGICRGTNADIYTCKEITVNSGGICIGEGDESCRQAKIQNGGMMIAKSSTAGYGNTYSGTGCCVDCVGSGYCHDSGHVCSLSAKEREQYCSM
ncbi:MAG: prepilin-type N-terminal cleavage/methylation domain-containing protein [Elusimicrobiaceae bacterium]|nr:prepilin-type N-terminal cleavage/methylation domain-containing protein [Elusimicrobiaceae bacterium]